MRKVTSLVLLALIAWAAAAEERVRYDNYKMYRITAQTEQQFNSLRALEKPLNLMNLNIDRRDNGGEVDMVVSAENAGQLEAFLNTNGIKYDLAISNIQELIDAEMPKTRSNFAPTSLLHNWTDYATYDEINAFIDEAAEKHSRVVTLFTVGQSYEGRDIRGLKISHKKGNKAILLDSNIHAIEWVSSAVVTYITDQLLNSKEPLIRLLAMNFDWYIVPIVNPDGFVYTHDINRLWRKNRRPNDVCIGTDLNRNFDIHWKAASADPCDHMYAGPYPNSEPEVVQYSNFIMGFPDDYLKIYLAFHMYGQYVLTPWGHTAEPPPGYDTILAVARGFSEAAGLRYGSNYTAGPSATIQYPVTGAAKDFGFGVKGIPISFTIECRDKGQTGFFLDKEEIRPNAEEAFDGLIALILKSLERGIV